MTEFIAYFNGEWIPSSECRVSVADRGFRLGDAVFEAERTFNGKIFALEPHLNRFYRSLRYVRIDPGITKAELAQITEEVVRRNEHLRLEGGDFAVRQMVSRGIAGTVTSTATPTVYVGVNYVNFKRFASAYEEGCHVVFPQTRAYHPASLDPKIKHHSRLNFVLAELESADIDPEAWPVLLDHEGNITEGTVCNFWLVKDGVLKTSGNRSILQGITRGIIQNMAKDLGIPVAEEDLQIYDAYTADEAFISGTSYCVAPVSKMDSRSLDGEIPGPITKQLMAAWSEKVGVDIITQAHKYANITNMMG